MKISGIRPASALQFGVAHIATQCEVRNSIATQTRPVKGLVQIVPFPKQSRYLLRTLLMVA